MPSALVTVRGPVLTFFDQFVDVGNLLRAFRGRALTAAIIIVAAVITAATPWAAGIVIAWHMQVLFLIQLGLELFILARNVKA